MEGPVPNDFDMEAARALDKRKQKESGETTRGARREAADADLNNQTKENGQEASQDEGEQTDAPAQKLDLSASEIYQLMSYHVQLNERRRAQFAGMANGTVHFFDETSLLLVYVQNQELRVVSCRPSTPSPDGGPTSLALKAGAPPKLREEMLRMSFKTLDTTSILGAKVAPDNKYIAIQRSPTEIHFFSLDVSHNVSWTQPCKRASTARILDFFWTVPDNLLMVTTTGVELYQLPLPDAPKPLFGQLKPKLLKEFKAPISWAIYSPMLRMLVASVGGRGGSTLQVFYFKKDTPIKLQRFDIDLVNEQDLLLPGDLFLAKLYGRIYAIHIHRARRAMVLYQITLDAVTRKNVYPLHTTGRMYPHVVDNLILLHDRDSKICMLYDIKDRGSIQFPIVGGLPLRPLKEDKSVPLYSDTWRFVSPNYVLDTKNGFMWEVDVDLAKVSVSFSKRDRLVEFLIRRVDGRPVLLPLIKTMIEEQDPLASIARTFDLINATARHAIVPSGSKRSIDGLTGAARMPSASPLSNGSSPARMVVTPARAVSDSQLARASPGPGVSPFATPTASPYATNAAGLRSPRTPASPYTTSVAIDSPGQASTTWSSVPAEPVPALSSSPTSMLIHSNGPSPAASPSSSFVSLPAVFNGGGIGGSLSKRRAEMGPPLRTKEGHAVIDQADMYAHVFLPLDDDKTTTNSKYFIAVVTEYIRSLGYYHMPIEDYIFKLLISVLVQDKRYYQLHQFLQYHIIDDSVHVACQLLSLEKQYPPAYQLALDMLKRLLSRSNVVADQIVEVLLTSGQFLPALRFIDSHKDVRYSVRRILEAAFSSGDDTLFYSVYRFFEKRGEITNECSAYTQSYHLLFNAASRGNKGLKHLRLPT